MNLEKITRIGCIGLGILGLIFLAIVFASGDDTIKLEALSTMGARMRRVGESLGARLGLRLSRGATHAGGARDVPSQVGPKRDAPDTVRAGVAGKAGGPSGPLRQRPVGVGGVSFRA